MKKKKSSGGGANWMDTYGDMVTLLLCFFVLLYSMSTISEDKWKALVQSFNPVGVMTQLEHIQGGDGPSADADEGGGVFDNPDAQEVIDDMIEQLAEAIQQMVNDDGLESTVAVTSEGGKIYITFSDQVFFKPDKAELLEGGEEVLLEVCGILDEVKDSIEEIRIQGHTAQGTPYLRNDPRNDRFLASNRATEVALFLQENSSLHPARVVSEGWGQWHPIASNQTEETKRFNRRVEMIITGRNLELEKDGKAIQTYVTQDNADMGIEE